MFLYTKTNGILLKIIKKKACQILTSLTKYLIPIGKNKKRTTTKA